MLVNFRKTTCLNRIILASYFVLSLFANTANSANSIPNGTDDIILTLGKPINLGQLISDKSLDSFGISFSKDYTAKTGQGFVIQILKKIASEEYTDALCNACFMEKIAINSAFNEQDINYFRQLAIQVLPKEKKDALRRMEPTNSSENVVSVISENLPVSASTHEIRTYADLKSYGAVLVTADRMLKSMYGQQVNLKNGTSWRNEPDGSISSVIVQRRDLSSWIGRGTWSVEKSGAYCTDILWQGGPRSYKESFCILAYKIDNALYIVPVNSGSVTPLDTALVEKFN